jgi:hypothetical protein
MDGMVNTGELSIHVVTTNKPKMLRGLGQKGTVAGTGSQTYPVMDSQRYRRTESTSPVLVNRVERGKPVSSLLQGREEGCKADQWRCGYGGGKKRRPSCHGTDTGCNITQRESAQTSLRCPGTRTPEESTKKVWQMSVVFHWCSLPREGIDVCLVSCSQQVVLLLTGPSHGL